MLKVLQESLIVIFVLNFKGMKKHIFCISIIFSCSFSFCKGQDTIVFVDGGKIAAKVLSVEAKKVYFINSAGKYRSAAYASLINYIHSSNGEINTIDHSKTLNSDTAKLPVVNLAFNIGYSNLIGGYGSTFNYPYDNEYCGFANGNVTTNLTLNLRMGRTGWSFTFISDYIRNTFNATGLLNEYGYGFINNAGNHTYNHFAFLAGLTKTWYTPSKEGYFGIRFMAGEFYFNFPKLDGNCIVQVYNTNTQQYSVASCNWIISHQIIAENIFQLGFTIGQYLNRDWNLFESCDLLFGTEEDIGGPTVQINTPNSNEIPPSRGTINAAPYLAMINFTGGIAYTFGK